MRLLAPVLTALAVLGLAAPAAVAAPPVNDGPEAPAPFVPFTARAAPPAEREAIAELAEAGPDAAVAPCLGETSFARTVWFRIDATGGAREVTIEAAGRTTAPVDLAVFVQPGAGGPPSVARPNACAGIGVEGADAAEDHISGLSVRVPPGRSLLVQVGRRGEAGSADDERVQLSLAANAVPPTAPKGDRAGQATPRVPRSGTDLVGLSGATTTEEDFATPRCGALASVWRRVRPRRSGRLTISTQGDDAGTLAVFRGTGAGPTEAIDCVDREGPGPLSLLTSARAGQTLWVRVGTDRPPVGARAVLRVARRRTGDRSSGGGCLGSPRATLSGSLASSPAAVKVRNRSRFLAVGVLVTRGPVCAARLTLTGPGGRIYARGTAAAIRGRQLLLLRRTRRLVRGSYRMRTEAAGYAAVRIKVPSNVVFSLS